MEQVTNTEEYKKLFFSIPLFRDLPLNTKQNILDKLDYQIYRITKKEVILRQDTPCRQLYVLLKGRLRADIIDGLGNEIMIEYIDAPRTFATPHLFSNDNTLPATFTVLEDGILLTATKDSLFKLISEEPGILKNFLCVTGNCNKCTVSRLRALSYKSVRGRFISYLLEHKRPNSNSINIVHNQAQLAEYLCVTRPALSKEINKMIKEGLIEVEGKKINLLNMEELQKAML